MYVNQNLLACTYTLAATATFLRPPFRASWVCVHCHPEYLHSRYRDVSPGTLASRQNSFPVSVPHSNWNIFASTTFRCLLLLDCQPFLPKAFRISSTTRRYMHARTYFQRSQHLHLAICYTSRLRIPLSLIK